MKPKKRNQGNDLSANYIITTLKVDILKNKPTRISV